MSKILGIIIPVGIGVFFVLYAYLQFSDEDLNEIFKQFGRVNYAYIILSLVVGLFSHLSRAYRWNFLLETLGHRVSFFNSVMAVFITYFMNLFVPRSGEISRAFVVQKYEGVPFDKAMGTIITERFIDLILLIGLVIASLIISFDTVNRYIFQKINLLKLSLVLGLGIAVAAVLMFFLIRSKPRFRKRLSTFFCGIKEGIFTIIRLKKKKEFIFHTLFIWGSYLVMFYIATLSIEATSTIGFGATFTTFTVGGIAIAFTNGGFGSYAYLVAEMLALHHVPETVGTAFGWTIWTSQFLMFVISGSLSFILLPFFNRKTLVKA